MGVVEGIKDTARKTTNSITDTIENAINKPKSPKELASRLVEHLSHQEYDKMAQIISEEARKYISKLGLEDLGFVNDKLDQFESRMDDLAKNLEEGDYQKIVTKLQAIEAAIPDQQGEGMGVLKTVKSFLHSTITALEKYVKEQKGGDKEQPDYSQLQDTFEKSFNELTKK